MKIVMVATILTVWMWLTPHISKAQTEIEVHRLPQYHITSDGACFDFPSFQALLVMDEDLHLAEIQVPLLQGVVAEREAQVVDFRAVIANLQYRLDLFREDRTRLFNLWVTQNLRMHELDERPDAGSWIAWAVAGVALAAAVVFGVTLGIVVSGN